MEGSIKELSDELSDDLVDEYIEKLMKIEDPFIRETIKLQKAQKQGLRKKEPEYEFQPMHVRLAQKQIMNLIAAGLSFEEIEEKINQKKGTDDFLRIKKVLNDIKESFNNSLKRLSFSKLGNERLTDKSINTEILNYIGDDYLKDSQINSSKKKKEK